jgi:hypothetical protein
MRKRKLRDESNTIIDLIDDISSFIRDFPECNDDIKQFENEPTLDTTTKLMIELEKWDGHIRKLKKPLEGLELACLMDNFVVLKIFPLLSPEFSELVFRTLSGLQV